MASRSHQNLLLAAVSHRRRTGRSASWLLLAVAVAHALLTAGLLTHRDEDPNLRAGSDLADAVAAASELEHELAEAPRVLQERGRALQADLFLSLRADLVQLESTVRDLRATPRLDEPPAGGSETSDDLVPDGPTVVERARRDIGSMDWILAVRDAEAGEALLAALEPIVEARITHPRFAAAKRTWEESTTSSLRSRLDAAAAAISRLRALAPEDRALWDELTVGSRELLQRVENGAPVPPENPRWWLSPRPATEEPAEDPVPSLDPGTDAAPVLAASPDVGEIGAAAEALHRRALAARDSLEIRLASRAEARPEPERGETGEANGLSSRPLDTLPLILGLGLAFSLLRLTWADRELLLTAALFVESGGPTSIRDWGLAQGRRVAPDSELEGRPNTGGWALRTFLGTFFGLLWILGLGAQLEGGWRLPSETLALTSVGVGLTLVVAAGLHRALLLGPALERLRCSADALPMESTANSEDWRTPADADLEESEELLEGHLLES